MSTNPTLSIVIPTHNRCDALQRTLMALAAQSYPPQDMQVIVVADSCTDDTLSMLSRAGLPYSLEVLEKSVHSAAAARNAGAAVARGDLLLFLDDDVEPTPGLVQAHIAAHQEQPDQVVLGPYPPIIESRPDFFRMELMRWWHDHFRAMYAPDHRFAYRDICTGNLSIGASAFRRLGAFDAAFINAGGEDYEFGIRVIKAGLGIRFIPEALGHHYDDSNLDRIYRRTRQEGRSDVLIGRRHPEMRSYLPLAQTQAFTPNRVVRILAFLSPSLGNWFAARLRALLNLYERAHLRRAWYKTFQGLHTYWYWRGVADELVTPRALYTFLQGGISPTVSPCEVDLDLSLGLNAAERLLDRERPLGMRVYLGQQSVGNVPMRPGIEALRGVHLRRILANEMAMPLLKAMAMDTANGNPNRPD